MFLLSCWHVQYTYLIFSSPVFFLSFPKRATSLFKQTVHLCYSRWKLKIPWFNSVDVLRIKAKYDLLFPQIAKILRLNPQNSFLIKNNLYFNQAIDPAKDNYKYRQLQPWKIWNVTKTSHALWQNYKTLNLDKLLYKNL